MIKEIIVGVLSFAHVEENDNASYSLEKLQRTDTMILRKKFRKR